MKKTIYVVEDDQALRTLLVELLDMQGHKVALAADGHEALAHLNEVCPDLVVADLKMATVDGDDLIGGLRADPEHNRVPVLVITGLFRKEQPVGSECTEVLEKPFSLDDFTEMVNALLLTAGG